MADSRHFCRAGLSHRRGGWAAPETTQRAVDEYLAVLDDAAFGGATDVTPKFISPTDPAARWTDETGRFGPGALNTPKSKKIGFVVVGHFSSGCAEDHLSCWAQPRGMQTSAPAK